MSNTPINQLNYVNYEIPAIISQIDNILLQSALWQDILPSSTGQILVSFIASLTNMLLYYIERTAEEMYINTAQRASSVNNLVAVLDYTPSRNISATGTFTLALSSPHSTNVYFPAQTAIQTTSGYFYNVTQSSVLIAGQTSLTVNVVEGQWFSNTYASNGLANQNYVINNTQVENTNYSVVVNGVLWTPITTWINSTTTSQVYKVLSNINGTLTIQFGNGVFGAIPSINQSIVISYLQSDGAVGNIYGTSVGANLYSIVYDATGTVVSGITISSNSQILGGANAESASQISYLAPQVFQTGQRAITPADFSAILNNYPGVGSANVWGENQLNPPNYNAFNTIFISTIIGTYESYSGWQIPTTVFNTGLGNFLYTQSIPCVKYSFTAPEIVQVMPYVSLYCLNGYSLSAIQANVNTAFQNSYLLGTTANLGQNSRFADVSALLSDIQGLDYFYLSLAVYQPLTASFSSSHDWGTIVPVTPITSGTIKLYTNSGTLIAQDGGGGGWISMKSGYSFSTTGIGYNSGSVEVNITPTQSATPYITYQTAQSGDIIVSRSQILQYYQMVTNVLQYG
jgi:hypothetical protein